ncbi:MAG: GNAT family N-acetyltransferase [Anaerolineales bacterium]|nr:GNAT family N-acetyltransferase [Anaerolineales bacterium]
MNTNSELFIRDLGGGLILRRASKADADALAEINSRMHSDDGPDKPNLGIAEWIRDLVTKPHPTMEPGDFTVVEETATGRIVSTLCLIPQKWTFDGIEFGVGRPELVCTLPEFRRRGLIRIQMEEVHKWSKERGDLVQVITGIPNYYRQFGYGMALELSGGRRGFEAHVPVLKADETESFHFRLAEEGDVDFIVKLYAAAESKHLLSCKRPAEIIRYEIFGKSEKSIVRYEKLIIEDVSGRRVGYFEISSELWMDGLVCTYAALEDGVPWLEVSPALARYLWKKGGDYAQRDGGTRTSFGFGFGSQHPIYEALDDKLPKVREPYAYYMRVPDLPAFLRLIRPVLERRLAESPAVGYSGTLRLSFYRNGVSLGFERGQIIQIEPMQVGSGTEVDALFPDLTFLHLLFGHRSLGELSHMFADCYANHNTARVLLNALFPKRHSVVLAVT